MTPEETAYVAGLYEGEGWVDYGKKGGLSARISMTDKYPLTKIHQFVPNSTLNGPRFKINRPNNKPLWTWGVYGKNAVSFLRKITKYVGRRRLNQINTALVVYKHRKADTDRRGKRGSVRPTSSSTNKSMSAKKSKT